NLSIGASIQADYETRPHDVGKRESLPKSWYDLDSIFHDATLLASASAPSLLVVTNVLGTSEIQYHVVAVWQVASKAPMVLEEVGSVVDPGLPSGVEVRAVGAVGAKNEPPTILLESSIGYH